MPWPRPDKLFFSGDSKYISYDLPAGDGDQRDVFLLAIDGSLETPVVVHPANDKPLGFSPDGTRLLFASDRTATMCLWAQSIVDGKPLGAPELLKADIGTFIYPLGVTTAGALYIYKDVSSRDIRIAPFDVTAAKPVGGAASFTQGFLSAAHDPDWSPDGKSLLYPATCGNVGVSDCMVIRSADTGQTRKLSTKMAYIRDPRWSPDGRTILTAGLDARGPWGIFEIDPATGAMKTVVSTGNKTSLTPRWSPDGRKIYYGRLGEDGVRIFVERDRESGAERVLVRGGTSSIELSPDGRLFAFTQRDDEKNVSTLVIVAIDGGQPRELMRHSGPTSIFPNGRRTLGWTPDSREVIVAKRVDNHAELWRVPSRGVSRESWPSTRARGRWVIPETSHRPVSAFRMTDTASRSSWARAPAKFGRWRTSCQG